MMHNNDGDRGIVNCMARGVSWESCSTWWCDTVIILGTLTNFQIYMIDYNVYIKFLILLEYV